MLLAQTLVVKILTKSVNDSKLILFWLLFAENTKSITGKPSSSATDSSEANLLIGKWSFTSSPSHLNTSVSQEM